LRLEANGSSLSYEVAGDGPALLLLHAFPLSAAMWERQAQTFAARCRVVRLDARGFGGSDLGQGPLLMEQIASDAAAVLDALGVRDAVVGGCSMGGYAALAFARCFPERVRALVLVDTKAVADTEEARAGRQKTSDAVRASGISALFDAMLPNLLGPTSHRERPALVARVRDWMRVAPVSAVVHALAGMAARPDARPTLPRLAVPALILRGEEDGISTPGDLEDLAHGLARHRAVTLAGAGHLASLEAPETFDAALGDFLDTLR